MISFNERAGFESSGPDACCLGPYRSLLLGVAEQLPHIHRERQRESDFNLVVSETLRTERAETLVCSQRRTVSSLLHAIMRPMPGV
eukprot:4454231-Heterocapsa_arctica.AAC.1